MARGAEEIGRTLPSAHPSTMHDDVIGPFALKVGLARAVGAVSRRTGRGGGTTLPGRLLVRLEPAGHRAARRAPAGRHRHRLRDQRQDDHGGDGRGHPRARRPALPQHGRRQPRLRRRLDAARGARGRAARAAGGRRVRAAGRRRPHVAAGAPARQPVPRPARPLRRARARGRALARPRRRARRRRRASSSAPTTPRSATSATAATGRLAYGIDDPARGPRRRRGRGRHDVLRPLRRRVHLRRRLPRPPRRLPLPALRPRPPAARPRRPRRAAGRRRRLRLPARRAGRLVRGAARRAGPLQRRERPRRARRWPTRSACRPRPAPSGWPASAPRSAASSGCAPATATSCCC